jgi:hypothetical protein
MKRSAIPVLTVATPDGLRTQTAYNCRFAKRRLTIRFKQRRFLCLLLSLLLMPSICSAYEEDFHYYVIYFLLRAKGFTADASHQIAGFSQYVDDNRKTEPIYQWPSTRAKFHFINSMGKQATKQNDEDARNAVIQAFQELAANSDGAKYVLGWRLHVFADTFSHDTFTAYWSWKFNAREHWSIPVGHADTLEGGHQPDRPYNDPGRAVRAAEAIYGLIPGQPSAEKPWSVIEPKLQAVFAAPNGRKLTERIGAMQSLIHTEFGENTNYDRREFAKEREQFERAVNE